MVSNIGIASRRSPLALRQAEIVADSLRAEHVGLTCEIKSYTTTGDKIAERRLQDIGGKALFTKEIDEAILSGEADIAVHSMKDMETVMHADLVIAAVLPRGDVRDSFISFDYDSLDDLPSGSVVGTSSLRRQAQVLHHYPHLRVETLRGNVATRLEKLQAGQCAATLLAVAGLQRLGLEDRGRIIPVDVMLPAVAQGALAVVCHRQRQDICDLLGAVHCGDSFLRVSAERSFLAHLGGSCRTPIAALANLHGDSLELTGLLADEDGGNYRKGSIACEITGRDLAEVELAAKQLADRLSHAEG